MATPISITIGQAFGYSGGKSCKPVYDFADSAYPGWSEDTVIDVLEWTEGLRAIGRSDDACYGIYNALNTSQQNQFILWALTAIIMNTTNEYGRKEEIVQLKNDLQSYIVAPTQAKKDALLAVAKSIKPNTSDAIELLVANAFKGVTNSVANGSVTGSVIYELATCLVRGGEQFAGKTRVEVNDTILTKIQQLIGIRD